MRRALLLAAAGIVAGTLAASAAASGGLAVNEAKGNAFPNLAFVISLPTNRVLSNSDIQVTENGNAVANTSVLSASQVGRRAFGVVLVLDASDSMAGRPIQSAIAAARAFAARRNPTQQFALVTFNAQPTVALPFTTSVAQIDAALSRVPTVAYGTHIYDAVAKAEQLLSAARIQAGSILVLSDGADTGSLKTGSDVAKVARTAHIKLYAIGLKSSQFDPSSLTTLADAGGGDYALAASRDQLAPLFDSLGGRLAQQYLLRYRSLAGPNVRVHVRLLVAGVGRASSAYRTPALPVATVAPYHRSIAARIWTSPVIMVLLALLAAGGVALLAISLPRRRRSELPSRMAEFVSVPGLQVQGGRSGSPGAGAALADGTERPEDSGIWARFDRALEIAEIKTSGTGLVAATLLGTAAAFLFLTVALGSIWWTLLAVLVPLGVRTWVIRTLDRRRRQFAEQLPDALQVISSALRSGHSFAGSLAVVVESAAEPMKTEMQRVVADEQRGLPLAISLEVVSRRMANRDLQQVGLVAELQREAGGNAAEVVDRVAETIRDRFELRRLISTLTVQGRMSRWIVSALPVSIIVILQIINPHYLHPLVAHTGGRIVLGFAAALCVGGSLVIKKIVDIKV